MKYVRLIEWKADGGEVSLQLLGEDDAVHRVEVGAECATAVVAALGVEVAKFAGRGNPQQLIRPTGLQTGRTDQGEPMIILSLKNDVELPLVFKPESLDVLISQLQGLKGAVQPGADVRWH